MVLSKSEAKAILSDVPGNKQFYLTGNKGTLKNLQDLEDSFVSMDDSTFSFHVTKDRNDFANWVKDTVGDQSLAKQISSTKQKEKIYGFVYTRLSQLNYIVKIARPKVIRHSRIKRLHEKIKSMIRRKAPEENVHIRKSAGIRSREKALVKKEKLLDMREKKIKSFESKLIKKKDEIIFKELIQGILIGLITAVFALLFISRYVEFCI